MAQLVRQLESAPDNNSSSRRQLSIIKQIFNEMIAVELQINHFSFRCQMGEGFKIWK